MSETELGVLLRNPRAYTTKVHAFDVTDKPFPDIATHDGPTRVTLCGRTAPQKSDHLGWYTGRARRAPRSLSALRGGSPVSPGLIPTRGHAAMLASPFRMRLNKKLSTLALVVAIMPLAFLLAVLPERDEPATLQLEEEVVGHAPAPDLADLVVVERGRATADDPEPEVGLVEPTPIELFLAARPQSPLALLPIDEAAKYLPTRENLVVWIESVDELDDVDVDAIEWTDDLQFLWGVCREHMALRNFILDHQYRERDRWLDRAQSVSLEAELHQVRGFMDRDLGHDSEVWRLISLYSEEVAAEILDNGEDAANGDDPASRWDLFSALVDAGATSFNALVETLGNSR